MQVIKTQFPLFAFNRHEGGWWFRLYGYGLRGIDLQEWPRDIQRGLVIGRWTLSVITP